MVTIIKDTVNMLHLVRGFDITHSKIKTINMDNTSQQENKNFLRMDLLNIF